MTTLNEKLTALAEEIERDHDEWGRLAEHAITAHTASERGARAAAHREDARRLRSLLASASTPEAAPFLLRDFAALVDAVERAAFRYHASDTQARRDKLDAARLALLSAIGSSVAAAREEGRREGIEEAGRETDELRIERDELERRAAALEDRAIAAEKRGDRDV